MEQCDDDNLIIDIATGDLVTDPVKINRYLANPDAYKKEVTVLCRRCYVDSLTKSLEQTANNKKEHTRIHANIYSAIRQDIESRILDLFHEMDNKYPGHDDTIKEAMFDEFAFNCETARLAFKHAGWSDKMIKAVEGFEIEQARKIHKEMGF